MARHSDLHNVASYIDKLFAPEDEVLKSIRQQMRADKCEHMSLSPHEGRLLQVFMRMAGVRSVVEIGTLYGYSALWMLRALPAGGRLLCLEKQEAHLNVAQKYLQAEAGDKQVQFFQGPALEHLPNLKGPFDMVFIDANKSGYNDYLDWAEDHIRPGGLIVGDNTFLFGHLTGGGDRAWDTDVSTNMIQSMKNFNTRLSDSSKYTSCIVPTGEGLLVALRR